MTQIRASATTLLIAVLLTLLFWGPLWQRYGFVGGDLYPYFFPQKAFFSDRLQAGEFPLWNNLTGFGYPVLGESQTGAAYPPHVVAYYLLDVNTAYNVEHLLHYVLCFVATWLFARRVGMGTRGSVLTALVFTYGWFPPRACLEWAIVTGAWLPVALWCVESFVQTRWWRYAIGLSFALGLQLLAGHFHLAFITQLLVVGYGEWRVGGTRGQGDKETGGQDKGRNSSLSPSPCPLVPLSPSILLAIAAGFLLASVQLLPAWELKTRSSRAAVGGEHDPSYGHLPPLYVSQLFAPFLWYSPIAIQEEGAIRDVAEFGAPWHWFGPHHDLEAAVQQTRFGAIRAATNKIEAHLYCGLVPLGLAVWWVLLGRRPHQTPLSGKRQPAGSSYASGSVSDTALAAGSTGRSLPAASAVPLKGEILFWLIAGLIALVYATGWLLPVARYLPGFNFFRGPGRYGIVTTLAVSLLAGRGLDALVAQRGLVGRRVVIGLVFWSTCGDLWLVSRMVSNVVMVSQPAISFREQSHVRKLLLDEPNLPRLYCPGQNVGNLLGVSCLPVYLGIAPTEYADPKFAGAGMPKRVGEGRPIAADEKFSQWLYESGVTHMLSFDPLDESSWRATLVWSGFDEMLNRAWGRREPIHLYRMDADATGSPPSRVAFTALLDDHVRNNPATVVVRTQREANRIVVEIDSGNGGELVLKELAYPDWIVSNNDRPLFASKNGFRIASFPGGVQRVTWTYRPRSVMVGAALSLLTLFVLAALGHLRFWHRAWLDRCLERMLHGRQAASSVQIH